jgi:hypothetical protein
MQGDESRDPEIPKLNPLDPRVIMQGDKIADALLENPGAPAVIQPKGDPVRAGVRASYAVQHATNRVRARSILNSQAAKNIKADAGGE